jgi:hypothetical protein
MGGEIDNHPFYQRASVCVFVCLFARREGAGDNADWPVPVNNRFSPLYTPSVDYVYLAQNDDLTCF